MAIARNYPYATIDPEVSDSFLTLCRSPTYSPSHQEARIPVPDDRFEWLCEAYKPTNRIPAFLTCIDIAGLTAGASTGAGLGNAFLSHVRAVDGIFQVVRAFDDDEIINIWIFLLLEDPLANTEIIIER